MSITYYSNTGLGYPTLFGVANLDIVINGTLIIDEKAGFHNCRIKMSHNARVIIPQDEQLLSLVTKWFACDNLWAGIEVQTGGALRSFGSHFEDAINLITADDGGKLTLYLNEFNRNYIGMTNGIESEEFAGIVVEYMGYNTFSCNSELNDPAIGAPYDPPVSYAGIYLDHGSMAVGSFGQFSAPNYFEYLQNGIVLVKSAAQISNMHFSNLIDNPHDGISGIGIAALNSVLRMKADLISDQWYGRCTFDNCVSVGVLARSSSLDITGPVITGLMAGGIESSENRQSESVSIKSCRIELDDPATVGGMWIKRGVGAGENPHYILEFDSVFVYDNYELGAWGINVEATDYPAVDEALLEDNYVYMNTDEGMTGIGVVNTMGDKFKIRRNKVISAGTTEGYPLQRLGIVCVAAVNGYDNEVIENEVIGSAVENSLEGAICIDEFTSTQVCDNFIDYSEIGFHLVGNNTPFEITTSDINRHERGLLIDEGILTSGMIGTQTRRNNVWGSSGDYDVYAAECNSAPDDNKFYVHSSATGILPVPRDPGGSVWFEVQGEGTNDCGENSDIDGLSRSDSLLIEDELFEIQWTDAQEWSAKKQLMFKLLRFPALRPNGSTAKDFFDDHINKSPGQHAQAEYDYMNALLAPSAHEDIDDSYAEILMWLDSLAVLQDVSRPLDTLDEDTGFTDDLGDVLDTLNSVLKTHQTYREDVRDDQHGAMEDVFSDLTGLPVDSMYEYYFMRTLVVLASRVLDDTISDAHLLTLDTIASEDPAIGGVAVKYARFILGPCAGHAIHEHPESVEEFVIPGSPVQADIDLQMYLTWQEEAQELEIEWNTSVSGYVRLVDVSGHVLRQSEVISALKVELGARLISGVYFVTFESEHNQLITKSIVIN